MKEVAEFVQARVLGDETVQLTGIASVESAIPGDLIFVDQEKNFGRAVESRASAVIVGDFAASEELQTAAAWPRNRGLPLPGLPNFFVRDRSRSLASIPAQSSIHQRNWPTMSRLKSESSSAKACRSERARGLGPAA